MTGALAGVVVADFSRVLAGPLATMLLADLGATVIKVEQPDTGDDTRAWGPPYAGDISTYYLSVNRNKRSVAIDLTSEVGRADARSLAARADVVVENFLPGRMATFGLDYPTVRAANPGAVYCSISGFGTGAGAAIPGYDFVVQAVGGLMSITGPEGGPPSKVGVAMVDVLTGLHACVGIMAGLEARHRSGEGQLVEVNLLSSLLASLINQGSAYLNTGVIPHAMGNQHPSIAPYQTLRASDAPLAVAVGNDRQFRALCEVVGVASLAEDPRFADNPSRVANRSALVVALEEALAAGTAERWAGELARAGVPCGPINNLAGAFRLAERLGLDPVAAVPGDDRPQLANPIRLSGTPAAYHRAPPDLGADDGAVLEWLRHGTALPGHPVD
jgi:crotonobetainyl-CoA:carnitine CoA-transferase CaiB-like acyl-CoA transferase